MRFGGQLKLVGWKNKMDPSPGLYSLHLDPSGAEQIVLTWNNSVQYWESGTWDGQKFTTVPELINGEFYNLKIENSSSGLYFIYELVGGRQCFLQIESGRIQPYALYNGILSTAGSRPRDQCAVYGLCGAYGSCHSNNYQFCTCVEGFTPADNHNWDSRDWWTSGCVRQSPLSCSTDEFIDPGVMLPDDSALLYPAPTMKDCQKACLRNCSCTAFTFNSPSGPCQVWSGDLLNMHDPPSYSRWNVSIRVAASALPKNHKWPSKLKIISILSTLAVALSIFSFLMWQRYRRSVLQSKEACMDFPDSFLRVFSYKELKIATRNFRSRLGSGGFGSVFEGSLTDDILVAVKKLDGSRQDDKQFRAEISSLGNIQHGNLIRLRGFCAEESRRLLVYDYMPNGSLDSFLFTSKSKSKRKELDWKIRFQIALGTARGLVYLHEECRDRIIHSDVKPENILLDGNFLPKLADFGLAKLVGRDFSRVLTTTRGTRGYLAPEWISGLAITPKVDVYSFGMTLLEIISGRRSLDLTVQDSNKYYFPPWAATQIYQGKTISIVDKAIAAEADIEEVRRAGVVGLLCIEREEEMRPSMEQVVRMLEGKLELQCPQMPISAKADLSDTDSDSNDNVVC